MLHPVGSVIESRSQDRANCESSAVRLEFMNMQMTNQVSFKNFVLDQLREISDLQCRSMFGGYGLYSDGRFFGIIHEGKVYFKTDIHTVSAYADEGMRPFQPGKKQTFKNYYEVPAFVLEDHEDLTGWATKAMNVES
jgi:DNA transformation protein and related proteins